MILCWKCSHSIDSPITFRSTCPSCSSDLHTCTQCRFYCPGKPNDCLVPGTDPIRDRTKQNLCEEFSAHSPLKKSTSTREEIEKKFFQT